MTIYAWSKHSTSECACTYKVCTFLRSHVSVTAFRLLLFRHAHAKPTSPLLTSIVLNQTRTHSIHRVIPTLHPPLPTKLSTKSWHEEAPTRRSAQKRNRKGSAYVQSAYDTSQDNCPSQADWDSLAARRGVRSCVCVCMWCTLLYSVCVCVSVSGSICVCVRSPVSCTILHKWR